MDPASTEKAQRKSDIFCDQDADVVFVSSDNVLFEINSIHLNLSTSIGLARDSNASDDGSDPILLPESFDVLEVIFQFIEPPPLSRNYLQPAIMDMEPTLFFRVAEAAEKYVVYSALGICFARMGILVTEYPLDVLNHSFLHGHVDLADRAARESLTQSLNDVAIKLTAPDLLRRFIIYYSKYRSMINTDNDDGTFCPRLAARYQAYQRTQRELLSKVNAETDECYCENRGSTIVEAVVGIRNCLPKFRDMHIK
ncbi:hypothetical protein BDN70DRAFT_998145 [Pholiota conissans]|uniref:BTB domain-containing protein n=1 Tax=Pholiota conissans TaxID=109636 RepID=A0A9P5YP53_9AGAR|nr:hypothetical protein BDN70DRAFT_998145 [Pholiota conissans]